MSLKKDLIDKQARFWVLMAGGSTIGTADGRKHDLDADERMRPTAQNDATRRAPSGWPVQQSCVNTACSLCLTRPGFLAVQCDRSIDEGSEVARRHRRHSLAFGRVLDSLVKRDDDPLR